MFKNWFSILAVGICVFVFSSVNVASADEPGNGKPQPSVPTETKPPEHKPNADKPADDAKKPEQGQQSKGGEDSKNNAKKEEQAVSSEPKLHYVKMVTSKGDIVIELNNEKAPISVKNFLSYVDKKFYDGTIFHRVIPGFMIQGGGFTPDMKEKNTDAPIKNEWKNGLKNERGALAMARTSVPDSATSQFFINVSNNSFLDEPRGGAAYAVFGRVISGMDIADKIVNTPRGRHGLHDDVPKEPITITSVTRMTAEEAAKFLNPAPAAATPVKK